MKSKKTRGQNPEKVLEIIRLGVICLSPSTWVFSITMPPQPDGYRKAFRILFLAAAHQEGCVDIGADKELKRFLQTFKNDTPAALIDFDFHVAVEKRDFERHVQAFKPDLLHISAHGGGGGRLMFGDEHISPDLIIEQLQSYPVKYLVIAACNVDVAAADYGACCTYLIGCPGSLHVETVPAFTEGFYAMLKAEMVDGHSIDVSACVQAGRRSVRTEFGDIRYKAVQTLSVLLSPKAVNVFERLRPIESTQHAEKCETYFDSNVAFKCQTTAVVVEFAASLNAIESEKALMPLIEKIRMQAKLLVSALKPEPLADTELFKVTSIAEALNSPRHYIDVLRGAVRGLYIQTSGFVELKAIKVVRLEITEAERIATIKAALMCKLEGYREGAYHIADFCESIAHLLSIHDLDISPTDEMLVITNQLLDSCNALVALIPRCSADRQKGILGSVAKRFVKKGRSLRSSIEEMVSNFPHYEQDERPGKPLWRLKEDVA